MTPNPSKAEEIAHYEAFLASLTPGTYLHAMFGKSANRVASEIYSDIAIGPVDDILAARDQARKELAEFSRQRDLLADQVARLQKTVSTLKSDIADVKEQARRLSL